jgi:hypothetical protein
MQIGVLSPASAEQHVAPPQMVHGQVVQPVAGA